MNISLSGLHWEVKGYWPYVPEKEKSMETGQTLHGVTDWLPAKVPGGVHYDLFRAGLIENPYYGKNSLHCDGRKTGGGCTAPVFRQFSTAVIWRKRE